MRRSLRNKHRFIWLSFTVALPLVLAVAWNIRPLTSEGDVQQNPGSNAGKWIEVDITPLVIAWLSGTPNFGLVMKAEGSLSGTTPESQYGFCSREFTDTQPLSALVAFKFEAAQDD